MFSGKPKTGEISRILRKLRSSVVYDIMVSALTYLAEDVDDVLRILETAPFPQDDVIAGICVSKAGGILPESYGELEKHEKLIAIVGKFPSAARYAEKIAKASVIRGFTEPSV